MMDFYSFYSFAKIVHIISVISWMAALFYLPRLFVYHSENFNNKSYTDIVKIQERKLMRGIGYPAMIVSLVSGAMMLHFQPAIFHSGMWIHIKLLFVIFLLIFHFTCSYFLRIFASDRCPASGKFFRFFNEIPTLILIVIVVCVVVRF